jgi:hypothetical protein
MKKYIMLMGIIILLVTPMVNAAFWLCLKKGETITYCNNYHPPKTCTTTTCLMCITRYDAINDCYVGSGLDPCRNTVQDCLFIDSNHTIDSEPPILNVTSPVDGMYYDSRSVPFSATVNEISDIYYYDNTESTGRWVRICDNCLASTRQITMKEGFNNITIMAKDKIGNPSYWTVAFFVDSIEPRIYSTSPEKGEYSNGIFTITYNEQALQNITLLYKIEGSWYGMTQSCTPGSRETCTFDAALPPGEYSLTYYFAVRDKASTVYSEETTVFIDTISPGLEVIQPNNPIYNTKKVNLDLTSNEMVTLEYIDNADRKPRWVKLCKDCDGYDKIRSLRDGIHNLTFRATDYAGNSVNITRNLIVDSKKPKIKKVEPRRGFTNGLIYVEFKEDNPKELVLNYGSSSSIDISDCDQDRRGYSCMVYADFTPYEGTELPIWFDLTDIADNKDQSRAVTLEVDTTPPMIDYINYEVEGFYVTLEVHVTEDNPDDILYSDNGGAFRPLCSRLVDGICKARKRFSAGPHTVTIEVTDKAGNSIAENADPFVI